MTKTDDLRRRVFNYFVQCTRRQMRGAADASMFLGIDLAQVRPVVAWLLKQGKIKLEGGNQKSGFLYRIIPGATPPQGRGAHQQHKNGPAWAAVRKRRQNLSRCAIA